MKSILADLVLGVASLAVAYGFWMAWHPLGFIVGGSFFVVFAITLERGTLSRGRKL